MGKRSDFEKRDKDKYLTPYEGAKPLMSFLPQRRFTFAEPCAGDGRLVRHIRDVTDRNAQCHFVCDIEPETDLIPAMDALTLNEGHVKDCELIITNPPWSRDKKSGYILHRMIEHFANLRPTWLLFDADWMHTKQATPLIEDYLLSVVSIGRVSWEQNGTSGKDNVAWYLFSKDARKTLERPEFWPRGSTPTS